MEQYWFIAYTKPVIFIVKFLANVYGWLRQAVHDGLMGALGDTRHQGVILGLDTECVTLTTWNKYNFAMGSASWF